MRLQYRLRFADYFAFNSVHQFSLVTAQLLYGALGLFIFWFEWEERGLFWGIVAGVIAYGVGWAVQLVLNVFMLYSGKNRTLLTDHVVEVTPEHFYEENPFCRSYRKWAGVTKVIARPGFVAVYINAHAAHIIPSRAFASHAERDAFVAEVRARIAAA